MQINHTKTTGDVTSSGRELQVLFYLDDHVFPCLIGKDASQIQVFGNLSTGAVTMMAIAADSCLYPGDQPGHGVDIDKKIGEKLAPVIPNSALTFPLTVSKTAQYSTGNSQT